jgi:hypothetical protein
VTSQVFCFAITDSAVLKFTQAAAEKLVAHRKYQMLKRVQHDDKGLFVVLVIPNLFRDLVF